MTRPVVSLVVLSAFAFFLLHLLDGCGDRIVDPPIKNPREYTWTIDTLSYPGSLQTLLSSIWASSPHDVYVVGHNERAFGKMYRYDGKQWRPVDLVLGIGSLSAIYGFGPDNIFAVGSRIFYNPTPPPNFLDSSLIIHYDGVRWREIKVDGGRELNSVWGSAPNDLWIGGLDGALYHYNGVVVRRDSIPFVIPKQEPPWGIYSIAGNSSENVYLRLYAPFSNFASRSYFLRFQDRQWVVVDSILYWSLGCLWMSPSGNLYLAGSIVYQRIGNSWRKLLDNSAVTANAVYGSGNDNIFVVGFTVSEGYVSGRVYHHNAIDCLEVSQLSLRNVIYGGVWTDGKEVFITGITFDGYPQKTIVLHGK